MGSHMRWFPGLWLYSLAIQVEKSGAGNNVCASQWTALQENKRPPCMQVNFTADPRLKCEGLQQSHAFMLQAWMPSLRQRKPRSPPHTHTCIHTFSHDKLLGENTRQYLHDFETGKAKSLTTLTTKENVQKWYFTTCLSSDAQQICQELMKAVEGAPKRRGW